MKALVNYDASEKSYLSMMATYLKEAGVQAYSTAAVHSAEELIEKARQCGADVILLCNESTLQKVLEDKSATLSAYRGSRFNFSKKILVLSSLAHMVTVPWGSWLMRRDLTKLQHINRAETPFSFTVLDKVEHFAPTLEFMKDSLLTAIDIETVCLNEDPDSVVAGDTVITSCSWTCLHKTQGITTFVLPLIEFDTDYWRTSYEYGKAIQFMQAANKLPTIKVMQNGMYDSLHLIRYHAEPYNWVLDTMGMQWAEFSELDKDLSFLSSLHLYDHIHWKEENKEAKKSNDYYKALQYNAKDTFRTLLIAIQQLRTMPAYAVHNYGEHFKLVYPCLYCAFEGLLIDNNMRLKIKGEAEERLEKALDKLRIMFANPNFNPGSWQQVEKYVYEIFGAKKPKIGKSKSCTDEKNLVVVGTQHPLLSKIVTEILSYREEQKAIGTYFSFKQINNRLLYSLDPFGTESGRMACRASSMWAGTQVQNIPDYAKVMLTADPGYVLCEIDNKQSEARCTAYLAQEEALIAALESTVYDFYKTLGTLFFNIPYEEVTDFFRNKVLKKIVHGTNYMMGAGTFIENIGNAILFEAAARLGITLMEIPVRGDDKQMTPKQFAKMLLDVYHKPFPRVREWYKEIYNEILLTGFLKSPNGFTRKFFGNITKDHSILRGAVAHEPQNLSVELLNKGFWKIYTQLVLPSKGEFRLKAQVHDSVLSQFPEEKKEYWVKHKQELMDNPIVIHGRTLSIPTDAAVGKTWNKKALTHV